MFLSLSLLLDYGQTLFRNLTENLRAGLPKLLSTVSENIERKRLFHQQKKFPSVSDFKLMIFGLLVKKFGRFTKTALYVSGGDFRRKNSFDFKSFFSISLWLWAADFQDPGENWRKYHQSCLLTVQTNILPKKCFEEKKANTFGFPGKKSQNFREKLLAWFSNFPSECPEDNSEETNLHRRVNSNHFLFLGEKVSNFYPNSPSRAIRTAFYVTRGWILGKKLLEVYSSLILSAPSKCFRTSCEEFPAGLSFMHFTRPKGVLEEIFVWNLRFTFTDFKR